MKRTIAFAIVACAFCWTLPVIADEAAKDTPAAKPAAEAPSRPAVPRREPSPDQELYMELRTLYMTGKLDEAEEKLKAGLEQFPDSQMLKMTHMMAYSALSRANRPEEAYAHLEIYVNDTMDRAANNAAAAEQFSNVLGQLASAAAAQGGDDKAMEVLEAYMAKAERNDALRAAVLTQKAMFLGKSGKTEEARAIIDEQVASAKKALEADAENADAVNRVASALKSRLNLESSIEGGNEDTAWKDFSDFLDEQARVHADNNAIAMRFIMEHYQRAGNLSRTNPDEAEAALKRLQDFQTNEGADVKIPAFVSQQIARLEKSIADTRRRDALVGSDAAYPENVVAWVNGEELTPQDLKGKVVLLDFFAVWCGPCVATFPHLRDWHDQYHNDGLEIIGLSNYQEYGWDEETKRPVSKRGEISPEEEHEAMKQFAVHHELRHPIGFTKDRSLSEHYVVSGIPHVVVIDRQGKVRLFKIGSGDANAHAVEEAIKECLAE